MQPIELKDLLSRHDLPIIAASINSKLLDEQAARQRYRDQLTPSEKAEFIGGEVIVHSPARAKHLRVTERLIRLVGTFVETRDLGEAFTEKALISLTRNDYEPDVCFFRKNKASEFDSETMIFPAPDFIAEVLSESTRGRDRGVKFDDYAFHAVEEYWIIDPDEETIEQYRLAKAGEQEYQLARKLTDGDIESYVVTGFRIPVRSLFDVALNLETLQRVCLAVPKS